MTEEPTEARKIEIAIKLCELAQYGAMTVWIDGGKIHVGPPVGPEMTFESSRELRRRITWRQADAMVKEDK